MSIYNTISELSEARDNDFEYGCFCDQAKKAIMSNEVESILKKIEETFGVSVPNNFSNKNKRVLAVYKNENNIVVVADIEQDDSYNENMNSGIVFSDSCPNEFEFTYSNKEYYADQFLQSLKEELKNDDYPSLSETEEKTIRDIYKSILK